MGVEEDMLLTENAFHHTFGQVSGRRSCNGRAADDIQYAFARLTSATR